MLALILSSFVLFQSSNPVAPPLDEASPPTLAMGKTPYERSEVRANMFTASGQDAVALAKDGTGDYLLAWHSRRQQAGTYGIYGRRFDGSGRAISGEVELNLTKKSMQTHPSIACDGENGVWVAWRSFGQDGDLGGIVARRFAPDLSAGTNEILVNQERSGDQGEALVLGQPDGGALILWHSDQGKGAPQTQIWAQRLNGDGTLRGAAQRVDRVPAGHAARAASAVTCGAGFAVAYAQVDSKGIGQGVKVLRYDEKGQLLGKVTKIDAEKVCGIEPVLAAGSDDDLYVAWFEAVDGDYAIRWRKQARSGELGPIQDPNVSGVGHISGLEIACDGERMMLLWNRFGDGKKRKAGLFAQLHGADGDPLGKAFRVTKTSSGTQAIASVRGTRRALFQADGSLAVAWHGNGDLGDGSAAHLTLWTPAGQTPLAQATPSPSTPAPAAKVFEPQGAAPSHEPPAFDPKLIDRDRSDSRGSSRAAGVDFLGITSTGWTPPDPEMAVGPNHVLLVSNGEIAWFDKTGNRQFQDEIEDSYGFWGGQGAGGFVFDPEALFDPHSQRFMAMANERTNGQSYFLLAISDDDDPNGAWHKYRIHVSPFISSDIDSPNMGVDDEAIYLTADFFSPSRLFVYAIDKASVLNGGTPVATHMTITDKHSMGTPVNYDAASPAQYLLWATEYSAASSIRIYALTDPLGSLSSQFIDLAVPSYSHPADPPQLGTSSRPQLFEARFWSCVVRDGHIWATHHQGSPARVRWYQIALNGWPTSGSPSLVQSGDVASDPGVFTFFGSIAANAAGDMSLCFAQSSSSTFISMARATRFSGDPLGTLRATETVRTSTAADTSGRWGDYSACQADPVDPGVFWGHHEYREGGWRTRVASWRECPGSISNYCTTTPNSAGPGATITILGSPSIAANDIRLVMAGGPPGEFGIFFYGEGQVFRPVGGGTLCVGTNFQRLMPAAQIDSMGLLFYDFDNTLPPNPLGIILDGSTWNFQGWFRDTPTAVGSYDFSDAVSVTFCP